MAPRSKSPLEPLVRLREERADAAARALHAATRERDAADRRRAAERDARARVERELSNVRSGEQRALEAGTLSAGDLAQAAKWGVEECRRREAARKDEERAAQAARAAALEVTASRARVGQAKADADAAARLLAKGRAAELAKDLATQEEAAEEAFAARARGRR